MFSKLVPLLERYELFLIIFIGIQPLIDVLTTFCLHLNISTTIGILIRFLILFLSIIYIFIKSMQIGKRKFIYYLIILFAVLVIGFINNHHAKPVFSVGEEGKYLAKVVYFNIMLLADYLAFKSLLVKLQVENKIMKYILISSLIINVVMIISIATSTSFKAYDYTKIGYTGWFYAGNEIGAILAIVFPLILLYSIKNTHSVKDIYKWIPTLLMIFSMLAVGTKVGYGACLITLLIAFVMGLFELAVSRKTKVFTLNRLRTLLIGITTVLLLVVTPFSPIVKNTFTHLQLLGIQFPLNDQPDQTTKNGKTHKKVKKKAPKINQKQMENLILSSRDVFLAQQKKEYKEAPVSQKLFGMGYSGNYTKKPKMIEMDFYDIFYSLGIIGSIVLLLPLLVSIIKIVQLAFTNSKKVFNLKYSMYIISILLGLGIALSAGHVFTAPAVSIYIAAILAFLLIELKTEQSTKQ